MYVYRTSQFDAKAERYGIQDRIDAFCVKLERERLEEVRSHFKLVYPYLKRKTDHNLRVIAKIYKVGNVQLLCFLDIFKRGDSQYQQFLEQPRYYGRLHLEPLLNHQILLDWLEQKYQTEASINPEIPLLPTQFHPWLEPPGWDIAAGSEGIIYESEDWVTRFKQPKIKEDWLAYYEIVYNIKNGDIQPEVINHQWGLKLYSEGDRYILFIQFEADTKDILFLLAPFVGKPTPIEVNQIKSKLNLSQEINSKITTFALRAYPAYLLADEESWFRIEQGAGNLALSPEEEQILQTVSNPGSDRSTLPLFINGRAGSGKSTLLIYLFADYCYRKYYEEGKKRPFPLPGNPIFLTYNERLLNVAKESVKTLLSSHHRFVVNRHKDDELPNIDTFFKPFQNFLIILLPPSERQRFKQEKYISFHRFKQLYLGKSYGELKKIILHLPEAKRYSPELCWHVIRTLIKGIKPGMTPEDCQEEIPRRERIISFEKYQGIYDTIWQNWYKRITQEQGYWDDQDLIAKVLELKCYSSDYTAIFCDEAQDFTRLELQLIMELSIFSRYHLGYQPIYSLPFAFAGDPFQTLNPTGFHWSSVQAGFEAEVISSLDPTEQLRLAINFKELTFNYRSSRSIVQFNNLIQLWRHILFEIPGLQPQTAWLTKNTLQPQKFIIGETISLDELKDNIKDTIIIIPCEEGEEDFYIQSDELLREICLPMASDTKNVLSAIASKGLEFKKVILYKFGEACNQGIWSLKNRSSDSRMTVEYFFNKLYVAASRATEGLFVVDSPTGDRLLWHYASSPTQLQLLLDKVRNKSVWKHSICPLSIGTSELAYQMREDDLESIAREFEIKGLNTENPSLLKRAKQFYSDLGNSIKSSYCQAWTFKFEEQFQEAGKLFLDVGEIDETWNCFWLGMNWQEMATLYRQYPHNRHLEYSLASFMISESSWEELRKFTQFLFTNYQIQTHSSQQWSLVFQEYSRRLKLIFTQQNLEDGEWQELGNMLVSIKQFDLAGLCFYQIKNYEGAVQCWEQGEVIPAQYNIAKAKILGLPAGLEYLEKAGESKLIIEEWKRAGRPKNHQWLHYLRSAFEKEDRYDNAFVVAIWLNDLAQVKVYLQKAITQNKNQTKVFRTFVQYLLRHQYWNEAIATWKHYPQITKLVELKFDFVYDLAYSELTPDQISKKDKQRYETFIKEQILNNSDWKKYLLMQQVGVTLEKIGLVEETLKFYKTFVSHANLEWRQFARDRWLFTKKKQEEEARNQGQIQRAETYRFERVQKAADWKLALRPLVEEIPSPPKNRPVIKKLILKGLPLGTKVEQLSSEIIQFKICHLTIKVFKKSVQIVILDSLTNRQIFYQNQKIQIENLVLEAADSRHLIFTETNRYKDRIIHTTQKIQLDLKIKEVSNIIQVLWQIPDF